MLDFVRQFARFEAQETIQDREVATHERDLRMSIMANHTTINVPSCTYSSARRGYLCLCVFFLVDEKSSLEDG